MDEKLNTTIQRIKLLAEQNPEFKQEMQKMFGKATSPLGVSHDERISQMLKYLGLDAHVDHMDSVIDYSFISEEVIRNTLESDNREMIRFRYGTRYHAICFDEFCRYAHLQAEMLINYFYYKKDAVIDNIVNHLKQYNPKIIIKENIKTLGEISYSSKLWAFNNELKLDYYKNSILGYIRKIRNDSSHRSPEKEVFTIKEYRDKLIKMGMPLKSDGDVAFNKLDKTQKKVYYKEVMNEGWYDDYKYLVWLNEESFDKVNNTIDHLRQKVKDNIST